MLLKYWNTLPIGKENAVSYDTLCEQWKMNKRRVRGTLHALSLFDSGDNYILIRSSSGAGFYRTDDIETIKAFKKECTNKAKSNFAPLKKINRILNNEGDLQTELCNNLKNMRISREMTQKQVCEAMKQFGEMIDCALLSRFENSVCFPTPYQIYLFARIFDCEPSELINYEMLLDLC